MRLVLALLALALAAPAASAGILAPEDATEAANALADAQEEQDVCYGWLISNDFDSSPDIGSSTGGPGVVVDLAVCPRYVMLTGSIHYACGSCEDSDAGRVGIETNLVPPPATKDLENLGLNADDLTGDNDDVTLMNMIEALPLLAAQSGAAPALVAETPTAVPATDVATNKPGSDFMREAWLKLLIFIALLSAGPLIFFYKRAQAPTPKET